MTTNPATDLEERRLRDAVVEAGLKFSDRRDGQARVAFYDAAEALRDYRAKSSAPEPTPPHEPPEGFQRIASAPKDGTPIWTWHRLWDRGETIGRFDRGTEWVGIDRQSGEFGFGIPPSHWAPIALALPNTPQIPTHESIIQWAKEKDKESLRTGKALKWTELIPDFARVFGLAQPDTRVQPTDEAIEFVWRAYGGPFVNDDRKRSFATEQFSDAARHHAKRSSATSLSNETLHDLWRLAHQEAPDQFVTDAKRVVGRSNT